MAATPTFEQTIADSAECCAATQRSVSQTQKLIQKARETIEASHALIKRVDDRLQR